MPTTIPSFALYGDSDKNLFPDYVHLETIRTRSEQTGWKFRPHQHHNLYQFFYIDTGGGECQINGKVHDLSDKTLIAVPPTHVHGFVFSKNTKGWVLSLPDVHMQHVFNDEIVLLSRFNHPILIVCGDVKLQNRLRNCIEDLHLVTVKNDTIHTFLLKEYVAVFLGLFLQALPITTQGLSRTHSRQASNIRTFQSALDAAYKTRKTVQHYADDLGITSTHLNRLCQSHLGQTASSVIAQRTILEAKRDLIYTAKTISDIAYDLGFKEPAHFSKFFTAQTAVQPSKFRKHYLARS